MKKQYSEMLNEIDKNIKFFGDDSDQKPQAPPVNPAVDFSFAVIQDNEKEQMRVEMPQGSQRESNATPQNKNEEFIQAMYKTTI